MNVQRIVAVSFALGLFNAAAAQNCDSSPYAKKGSKIETTEYDKKGAIKNVAVNTVTDVQINGGTNSTFRSVKTDANGTVTEDRLWHYRCNDNGIVLGFGIDDTETKQEAILDYPTNMATGQTLKNNIKFEISKTENGQKGTLTIKIYDRKVVGKEYVTVKAGSWECTKITSKALFKLKLGPLSLPISFEITEWFNPQVGVVRSETWLKGSKEGTAEITSISKS